MKSGNTTVEYLHRFIRHFAFCYGGATGRRVEEAICMMYAHSGLIEEPGVADGRIARMIVGWAKNNKDGERSPVYQPLYPVRDNIFVCPALVCMCSHVGLRACVFVRGAVRCV